MPGCATGSFSSFFAPLILTTDGRRWRMVGDSPLYARFGTQGGLSFPELPTASSPAWDFPIGESVLNYNTTTGREPMRSRYIQRSDAHLLAACDGPTEATLAPVLSPEERAIAALGELGLALDSEDRQASVATWFSPGLRKARGDPAIVATIERYRKGAGAHWWPIPVFINDDDVVARSDRIEVAVTTTVPSPRSARSHTPVKFRFEMIELEGRFLVDRVTAAFEIEPGNAQLLEIASTRLFP